MLLLSRDDSASKLIRIGMMLETGEIVMEISVNTLGTRVKVRWWHLATTFKRETKVMSLKELIQAPVLIRSLHRLWYR